MKHLLSLFDDWLSTKYFLGLQWPSKEQRKNATRENRIVGTALMLLAIALIISIIIREYWIGW
jgi:hypothetical protein